MAFIDPCVSRRNKTSLRSQFFDRRAQLRWNFLCWRNIDSKVRSDGRSRRPVSSFTIASGERRIRGPFSIIKVIERHMWSSTTSLHPQGHSPSLVVGAGVEFAAASFRWGPKLRYTRWIDDPVRRKNQWDVFVGLTYEAKRFHGFAPSSQTP